jgi:hypothetical protein
VTIAKRRSHRVRDAADDASDLGVKIFSEKQNKRLRQNGTTVNLSMARMRELPVGQSLCASADIDLIRSRTTQ